MIGIDTNVLVRFLVEDDVRQTARVKALFRRVIEAEDSLFVSHVVACELSWVLVTCYRFDRAAVVRAVLSLLASRNVTFEDVEAMHRAVSAFAQAKGDLADYLIRERGRKEGCETVFTFDGKLLADSGFSEP